MIKKLIAALFGKKNTRFDGMSINFHKDVNDIGEHGTIYAHHKQLGLIEYPVRFAFVGVDTPPKLDLATYQFIWDQAERQGYTPLSLRSYRGVFECHAPRKPAMSRTHGEVSQVGTAAAANSPTKPMAPGLRVASAH